MKSVLLFIWNWVFSVIVVYVLLLISVAVHDICITYSVNMLIDKVLELIIISLKYL